MLLLQALTLNYSAENIRMKWNVMYISGVKEYQT